MQQNKLRIIAKLCARKGGDAIDEKFRCRLQVMDEEVRDGFVGFESVATVLVSAFFDDFGWQRKSSFLHSVALSW